MALVVANRWHTFAPAEVHQEELPSLEDCIGATRKRNEPLYNVLATTLRTATGGVKKVLAPFVDSFDARVRGVKIAAWDRPFALRAEYEALYGEPATDENVWPLTRVIGRLLTYANIYNELRRTGRDPRAFFNPPPDVIVERPTQTYESVSTPPTDPRLGPVFATGLDPRNNYGVYKRELGTHMRWVLLAPLQEKMRCCHEHVGQTEGCWISLDPRQPVGEPVPYALLDVDHWDDLVTTSKLADKIDFKTEARIGTAFKDAEFYLQLHDDIRQLLRRVDRPLRDAFVRYVKRLDAAASPAIALPPPLDPCQHDLLPGDKDLLIQLLQTYFIFNEVHGFTAPVNWIEYINVNVFRVYSAARVWTNEKRNVIMVGGKKITLLHLSEVSTGAEIDELLSVLRAKAYNAAFVAVIEKPYRPLAVAYTTEVRPVLVQVEEIRTMQANLKEAIDYEQLFVTDAADMKAALVQFQIQTSTSVRAHNSDRTFDVETPAWKTAAVFKKYDGVVNAAKKINVTVKRNELLITELQQWINAHTNMTPTKKATWLPLYDELSDDVEEVHLAISSTNSSKVSLNPLLKYDDTERIAATTVSNALQKAIDDNNMQLKTLQESITQTITVMNTVASAPSKYTPAMRTTVLTNMGIITQGTNLHVTATKQTPLNVTNKANAIKTYESAIKAIDAGVRVREKNVLDAALAQLNSWAFPTSESYTIKMDALSRWLSDPALTSVSLLPNVLVGIRTDLYSPIRENYDAFLQAKALAPDADTNPQKVDATELYRDTLDEIEAFWLSDLRGYLRAIINNTPIPVDWLSVQKAKVAAFLKRLVQYSSVFETPAQQAARLAREDRNILLKEDAVRNELAQTIVWLSNGFAVGVGAPSNVPLQHLAEYVATHAGIVAPINSASTKAGFFPLYRRLDEKATFFYSGDESGKPFPVNSLWVEGAQLDEIFTTYRLLVEYLIHAQSRDTVRVPMLNAFLAQVNQFRNFVKEQPDTMQMVDAAGVTVVTNTTRKMPVLENGASAFNGGTLEWKDNSCWIDSGMTTLFTIPETTWSQYLFQQKVNVYQRAVQLTFPNGSVVTLPLACEPKEITLIHDGILEDIQSIQSDTPEKGICKSRSNWRRFGACLLQSMDATKNAKSYDSPATFFESFIGLYGRKLGIQFVDKVPKDSRDSKINVTSAHKETNVYVLQVMDFAKGVLASDKDLMPEFAEYVVDESSNGFQLAAMISGSNDHFVSYIKDLVTDKWVYINNGSIQSLPSLPAGTHAWRSAFRPSCYVYYRDAEVARIRANAASKKKATPQPQQSTRAWILQDALAQQVLTESDVSSNAVAVYLNSIAGVTYDATLGATVGLRNARGEVVTRWTLDSTQGPDAGTLVLDRELWESPSRRAAFLYMQQLVANPVGDAQQFEENLRQAMVAAHFASKPFALDPTLKNDLGLDEYPMDPAARAIVEEYVAFTKTAEAQYAPYRAERARITKLRIRK